MEILTQKQSAEIIDKDYKVTVVKFHDKEQVDNDCPPMKDRGFMIMQACALNLIFR